MEDISSCLARLLYVLVNGRLVENGVIALTGRSSRVDCPVRAVPADRGGHRSVSTARCPAVVGPVVRCAVCCDVAGCESHAGGGRGDLTGGCDRRAPDDPDGPAGSTAADSVVADGRAVADSSGRGSAGLPAAVDVGLSVAVGFAVAVPAVLDSVAGPLVAGGAAVGFRVADVPAAVGFVDVPAVGSPVDVLAVDFAGAHLGCVLVGHHVGRDVAGHCVADCSDVVACGREDPQSVSRVVGPSGYLFCPVVGPGRFPYPGRLP